MKKIKFLLDTANIEDIKEAVTWGCFSGVTTNPVILSKETNDYRKYIEQILKSIPNNWDLSAEVKATNAKDMVRQAKILSSWDQRVRVKIPATVEGLKAISVLIDSIPLNITIVKLAGQAMLCEALAQQHKPKSVFLSVFCGRINQAGYDWKLVLKDISSTEWPGEVLAASIKTPKDISDAITNGATIVTAPFEVYKLALNSPLVAEDVDLFNRPFDGKNFEVK
jgi:transaldolase